MAGAMIVAQMREWEGNPDSLQPGTAGYVQVGPGNGTANELWYRNRNGLLTRIATSAMKIPEISSTFSSSEEEEGGILLTKLRNTKTVAVSSAGTYVISPANISSVVDISSGEDSIKVWIPNGNPQNAVLLSSVVSQATAALWLSVGVSNNEVVLRTTRNINGTLTVNLAHNEGIENHISSEQWDRIGTSVTAPETMHGVRNVHINEFSVSDIALNSQTFATAQEIFTFLNTNNNTTNTNVTTNTNAIANLTNIVNVLQGVGLIGGNFGENPTSESLTQAWQDVKGQAPSEGAKIINFDEEQPDGREYVFITNQENQQVWQARGRAAIQGFFEANGQLGAIVSAGSGWGLVRARSNNQGEVIGMEILAPFEALTPQQVQNIINRIGHTGNLGVGGDQIFLSGQSGQTIAEVMQARRSQGENTLNVSDGSGGWQNFAELVRIGNQLNFNALQGENGQMNFNGFNQTASSMNSSALSVITPMNSSALTSFNLNFNSTNQGENLEVQSGGLFQRRNTDNVNLFNLTNAGLWFFQSNSNPNFDTDRFIGSDNAISIRAGGAARTGNALRGAIKLEKVDGDGNVVTTHFQVDEQRHNDVEASILRSPNNIHLQSNPPSAPGRDELVPFQAIQSTISSALDSYTPPPQHFIQGTIPIAGGNQLLQRHSGFTASTSGEQLSNPDITVTMGGINSGRLNGAGYSQLLITNSSSSGSARNRMELCSSTDITNPSSNANLTSAFIRIGTDTNTATRNIITCATQEGNGFVTPNTTVEQINTAPARVLVTKEWVQAQVGVTRQSVTANLASSYSPNTTFILATLNNVSADALVSWEGNAGFHNAMAGVAGTAIPHFYIVRDGTTVTLRLRTIGSNPNFVTGSNPQVTLRAV